MNSSNKTAVAASMGPKVPHKPAQGKRGTSAALGMAPSHCRSLNEAQQPSTNPHNRVTVLRDDQRPARREVRADTSWTFFRFWRKLAAGVRSGIPARAVAAPSDRCHREFIGSGTSNVRIANAHKCQELTPLNETRACPLICGASAQRVGGPHPRAVNLRGPRPHAPHRHRD